MRISILFASLLAACAATTQTDPTGAPCEGKCDGTNPVGYTAELTVIAQAGAPSDAVLWASRKDGEGGELQLVSGQPRSVSPATYCVWTSVAGFVSDKDCSVQIADKASVTYKLGSVRFVRGSSDVLVGADLVDAIAATPFALLLQRTDAIPFPAGNYSYPIDSGGLLAPEAFHVDHGHETTIDLTDTTGKAALRLLPSTGRTLPDGGDSYVAICAYTANPYRATYCLPYFSPSRPVLWIASNTTTGETLRYLDADQSTFESILFVNDHSKDIQLRRIDLDDVRVTGPSGSVQTVPGRAVIVGRSTAQSMMGSLPTGKGYDVPPDVYDVTTYFTNPADNTPDEDHEVLDLH